ncbi:MAG: type II secretion system GspH family protein [Acidobacteriia bacterium]|nr:type II secretion system GspH family protein [Terriglobia bacterium]
MRRRAARSSVHTSVNAARRSACATWGFTFVELMIVMAIIAVLLSVAIPIYSRSITRSKESVLKNNLFTLRTVIDEYTYDKQKAPQTLQDLVSDGYLRTVPVDPMTGSADSWKIIQEDATNTVNQTQPGIFDVRSGSDKISLEGTPYSDW